ncbi:Nucleolar protein 9 [Fulvia fulva]|uniref:Nucleolar protein 9 n=1 Tax=Passalora fulva TaxID=5499 RepID=A0A9Q8PJL6_PASFU|nr:Nucleolar protein 9 [Fulvia fulva]KAK4611508.1 Nucleolar protein 9 [Fulvia fulva]KAK4613087.1 Nucleolar protein 9 [Fulvia fulva]UJO23736.1 Nucleolar protein 9 [Fulvia fulva]WPV21642.1 Nucleolar protein 9 [Fulvia fulva]WPV36087.1 Nucleolar protein 9 [Fulvia fulva]
MPKALQKRGRRMKRKHEDDPEDPVEEGSSKRQKSAGPEDRQQKDFVSLDVHDEDMSAAYPPMERAFFGMLDEEEQEYFKSADAQLERNEFETSEDRANWLESVWREADGKELKIAQSQSCSRLMERLISISTGPQLKNLFQKFSGNFIHLMSHRFASHCCETLFTHAAPHVSDELRAGTLKAQKDGQDVNDVYVSMENLFLHTLAELEGNVGFLLTDRYASHALRILLLVLAGKQTSTESLKGLLQSKRKEGVTVSGGPKPNIRPEVKDRPVPKSFSIALEKLISDSMAGLDTDKLRALATHTNANPTLQLLLSLELTQFGKSRAKDERSIIKTLLPDEPFTADCGSAAFLSGMVYDPVGSHLVEKIIECAPAKVFKALYNSMFKERLASYARNEMGTYVDCRIIERLGYDDLMEAHEVLCPVIPSLLEKNWTSLTRTLIERCTIRDIDTQAIAAQIDQTYQGEKGFDVTRLLKLNARQDTDSNQPPRVNGNASTSNADSASYLARPTDPTKVHFNILAQAMLIVPGSLSSLVLDSLIDLEPSLLLTMANDHIVTRTLQQALTTKNSSMIARRKLIQQFYGSMGDMALDKAASHVVDCIWEGTHGLAFIRERIAEELAENEAQLRDSPYGRAVWKNWKMDMYKRRRSEWVRQSKIKASNDGFQDFDELDKTKDNGSKEKKTPLQLARERHAQNKAKKDPGGPGTGSRSSNRSAAGASRPAVATASG